MHESPSKSRRWYFPGMKRLRALALTSLRSAWLGVARLELRAERSRPRQSAPSPQSSPDLQIQSHVLRIEFDRKLHSRVVPLFGGTTNTLVPFSASETVAGTGHIWSDFALTSSQREHVSDVFGAGERLSLTGKSGSLRKKMSVTIYNDFPSIAVFDVEYTNQGKAPLADSRLGQPSISLALSQPTRLALNSGPTRVARMRSGPTGCSHSTPDFVRRTISA